MITSQNLVNIASILKNKYVEHKDRNRVKQFIMSFHDDVNRLMTPEHTAWETTDIIKSLLSEYNICNKELVDCTACVGGDSLPLSTIFLSVVSLEIDSKTFEYLKENIRKNDVTSIIPLNSDCISYLKDKCPIAIYIDPLWGGKDYKKHEWLQLDIDSGGNKIPIELILENENTKKINYKRIIFYKLPLNYNFIDFDKILEKNKNIISYIYRFKKMFLLCFIINEQ